MGAPIILGIAGGIRSGKTSIAKCLAKNYNMSHYENSQVLRNILTSMRIVPSRENMYNLAQSMFSELGRDILARAWVAKDGFKEGRAIIVSGIRYPEELSVYRENGNFIFLYVDCPLDTRKSRMKFGVKDPSDDELHFDMESENYQKQLRGEADFIVDNGGRLEISINSIESFLSSMGL